MSTNAFLVKAHVPRRAYNNEIGRVSPALHSLSQRQTASQNPPTNATSFKNNQCSIDRVEWACIQCTHLLQ